MTVVAASVVLAGVPAAAVSAGSDSARRDEVAHLYVNEIMPALDEPVGWTGSVAGCRVGTISNDAQDATRSTVNALRALAGLDAVEFSAALSKKAQAAALVYRANRNIVHDIPSSWDCFSDDARQAGKRSNIALGLGGATAVTAYVDDPGAANSDVGHRRWLLYPPTTTMGSGSTSIAHALWVIGPKARAGSYADPQWVSWPTAGYFPTQLEPGGRWSLSGDTTHDYDFGSAKVTVTNSAGKKLRVKVHRSIEGYGNDTLVWEVPGIRKATGDDVRSYRVSVSGIVRDGSTVSREYTVKLFDPVAWLEATQR